MKDKILYLILGILIGAVITAGCFLVFAKSGGNEMKGERPDFSEMKDFKPDGNMVPPDMGNMVSPDGGSTMNPQGQISTNNT